MIRLTRLRSPDPLYINPDHIERLDRAHDTVVRLLNGNEYVVVETPDEIVEQMTYVRAKAIALAARLAAGSMPDERLATIDAAAAVQPLPQVENVEHTAEAPTPGTGS